MRKRRFSEKAIPLLFDVVVWGGFAAFLFASYIACQTLLERFPGPVNKIMSMFQNFVA
ncbi:hypothetical protein [Maridesulfovibrio salexigens]|uniref:Uncharacterized protein n=1 Tax=Maridesulfovibrio salexigens (strain ATCC 14822 / DSM 2638 / NCIMB 8403 / VKM B-1763) TaxID=526222 RepID=C6BZ18_MARSD|nr:hypothetical protein [Maridesulfovibrio salexigens]ACS78842.1 hypothetical protein Desal_0776 [Maridesulfovibrio salexigens DSM 2638]